MLQIQVATSLTILGLRKMFSKLFVISSPIWFVVLCSFISCVDIYIYISVTNPMKNLFN